MSYSALPTRTSSDPNAAADINQLQANIAAVKAVTDVSQALDVRHTVLSGQIDSDGYADFMTVTSNQVTLVASTATSVIMTFSDGYGSGGTIDYIYNEESNQTSASWDFGSTATGNYFLYADYDISTSSVTYGSTRVPPQYGYALDKTAQSLLHFEGSNGSTTITDEYNNTWTANGNAQISTGDSKFGSASLILDGTGDYVGCTDFTGLGKDGFCIELWFNLDNAATTVQTLFHAFNNSNYGVWVLYNNGGSGRMNYYISDSGSSWNIASNANGTKTSYNSSQWYHFRIEWDGANIKAYVDGVLDYSNAMTLPVNTITGLFIGSERVGANYFDGYIDEFRFTRDNTRDGAAFTPPVAAYSTDAQFFRIGDMKMYEGDPDNLTQTYRLFLGEYDGTNDALTIYTLKGIYQDENDTHSSANSEIIKTHKLGVTPNVILPEIWAKSLGNDVGYLPGDIVSVASGAPSVYNDAISCNRTQMRMIAMSNIQVVSRTAKNNTVSILNNSEWSLIFKARRSF